MDPDTYTTIRRVHSDGLRWHESHVRAAIISGSGSMVCAGRPATAKQRQAGEKERQTQTGRPECGPRRQPE